MVTIFSNQDQALLLIFHSFLSDEQKSAIMERYGIPSIASYSNGAMGSDGKVRLVVYPGPTEKISWWVPHRIERELILMFANRLVDQSRTPSILEVGCGTGFLSKIIAVEGDIAVLGIDIDPEAIDKLPSTVGNISLRVANVWDVFDEFGPHYPVEVDQEVRERFQHTRRVLDRATYPWKRDMSEEEYLEYKRNYRLAKLATRRLQEIVTQYETPSAVDMVINSFMDEGVELTIPIRDGIHPKSIIYVRGLRNEGAKTGVDRYRENYDESFIRRNLMVSYDPGDHYKTIAHWRTFSKLDYGHHMYDQPDAAKLPVEVVVQLRRDVNVKSNSDGNVSVKEYPWDAELNDLLIKYSKEEEFSAATSQARNALT